MTRDSVVRIALVYPELLGTYGDRGNAVVLAQRLRWRGIDSELEVIDLGDPVPDGADIYVVGGGEDGPQTLAANELEQAGALSRAVDRGAAVLAICAGLQILGRQFAGPDGTPRPGLGLLDCVTTPGAGRAIGELAADPFDPSLPTLTGYENHGGRTARGPGASPIGRVIAGVGSGDGTEGVVTGRVVGTYLHGPALARNPALADLLIGWIVGPTAPLPDREVGALRAERLAALGAGSTTAHTIGGWTRRASERIRRR